MSTELIALVVLLPVLISGLLYYAAGLGLQDIRRLLLITGEFAYAFRKLRRVGPCVTFFASARLTEDSEAYARIRRLSGQLVVMSNRMIAIITAGGPGGMAAANRGAMENNGKSIGLGLQLSGNETANQFISLLVWFRHFFTRKICLLRYSDFFIVGEGGIGTGAECFEVLTSMQCGHRLTTVYVLAGPAMHIMLDYLVKLEHAGMIGFEHLARITLVVENSTPAQELTHPHCRVIREVDMLHEIVSSVSGR